MMLMPQSCWPAELHQRKCPESKWSKVLTEHHDATGQCRTANARDGEELFDATEVRVVSENELLRLELDVDVI